MKRNRVGVDEEDTLRLSQTRQDITNDKKLTSPMMSSMRYTVSPAGPVMAVAMIGSAEMSPFAFCSSAPYVAAFGKSVQH